MKIKVILRYFKLECKGCGALGGELLCIERSTMTRLSDESLLVWSSMGFVRGQYERVRGVGP